MSLTWGPPKGGWPSFRPEDKDDPRPFPPPTKPRWTSTEQPRSYEDRLGAWANKSITDSPPDKAPPSCYIAGPVRGDPNFAQKFEQGKATLERKGWTVISPLDIMRRMEQVPGVDADDRAGLAADIQALVHCSAVMLLPGWYSSRGAKAEVAVADALDIPCYEAGEWPHA